MSNCKLHPLVRLTTLCEMNASDMTQCFVVILQGRESRVCTGCTPCDFRDATLLFFRPGECKEYVERMKCVADVRALCYCGDWYARWNMESTASFFAYTIKESLHLSVRERGVIEKCFHDIEEELEWGIDDYSNPLIAQKIKQLFCYCQRFYDRQHITRSCLNATLMAKIEREVDEYLVSGDNCMTCCHVPAHRFAEPLGLSDAYFADFLKRETGKTIDKYVCSRHFEMAKRLLLHTSDSLFSIARKLGYHTVQSFSATFKRVLGCAPNDYRNAN